MSEPTNPERPVLGLAAGEYVAVLFAESREEAEKSVSMLEARGIPAKIEAADLDRGRVSGISVLVPDTQLDVASEVLAGGEEGWGDETELKDGPADDDEDMEEGDEDDDFDDLDEEEEEEEEDDDYGDDDIFDDDDDDFDIDTLDDDDE